MERTDQYERPYYIEAGSLNEPLNLDVSYFFVGGMNCPRCAERVRTALLQAPGVTTVIVDYPDGLTEVTYNPMQVTVDGLVQTVKAAGDGGHHNYFAQWIE
jgi:copper chaperone CopZ